MAVPRIRYAFGYFGDLRIACLIIFAVLLVISSYFSNRYLGMNIHSRVLRKNTGNFSKNVTKDRIENYVTVSDKGSFFIGSISVIYLIIAIYGLIAIISNEIHILIPPLVMLPLAAFIILFLMFFDLGIRDSAGFLSLWVVSGVVIKAGIIAASIYSFIVVFSYYMEVTQKPLSDAEDASTAPPKWRWFPRMSLPKLRSSSPTRTPPESPTPRTFTPKSKGISPQRPFPPLEPKGTPPMKPYPPLETKRTPPQRPFPPLEPKGISPMRPFPPLETKRTPPLRPFPPLEPEGTPPPRPLLLLETKETSPLKQFLPLETKETSPVKPPLPVETKGTPPLKTSPPKILSPTSSKSSSPRE